MVVIAPGIQKRKVEPIRQVKDDGPNETWVLGVEHHQAKKAGEHYDLRLIDPKTGRAHSWAIPKARWPKPGEKVYAARTWTHDMDYAMRQGSWELGPGYGEGKVQKLVLEPVEVIKADDKHVRFNRYGPGQQIEELSLVGTKSGNGAILYNHTLAGDVPDIPRSRGKYHESGIDMADPRRKEEAWQPKIDGAHAIVYLPKDGKQARVFSVRRSKKTESLIEHTPRLKDWEKMKTPPGYGGTILRAELWATDKEGRAVPPQTLAGMLNTSVWGARLKQDQRGYQLRLAPFDIVKWKGKPVDGAPYEQVLKDLHDVVSKLPDYVEVPKTVTTQEQKEKLRRLIKEKKLAETSEGIVIRDLKSPAPPVRAKVHQERDGKVVGFTPGKGKYQGLVGGLIVKDEQTGQTSVVGTGMSEQMRRRIAENKDDVRGMTAVVKVQDVFPSGKYRAPVFKGWHLDKNDPEKLEKVSVLIKTARSLWTEKQLREAAKATEKAVPDIANSTAFSAIGTLTGLAAIGTGVGSLLNNIKVRDTLSRRETSTKRRGVSLTPRQMASIARSEKVPVSIDSSESAADSAYYNRMAELINGNGDKSRGKELGHITTGKSVPPEIFLHELGHAKNEQERKNWRTARSIAMLGAGLGTTGYTLLDFASNVIRSRPLVKNLKARAVLDGLSGLTGLAIGAAALNEEHRASKKALEMMKSRGYSNREVKKAKNTLDKAYSTYKWRAAAEAPWIAYYLTRSGLQAAKLWGKMKKV